MQTQAAIYEQLKKLLEEAISPQSQGAKGLLALVAQCMAQCATSIRKADRRILTTEQIAAQLQFQTLGNIQACPFQTVDLHDVSVRYGLNLHADAEEFSAIAKKITPTITSITPLTHNASEIKIAGLDDALVTLFHQPITPVSEAEQ